MNELKSGLILCVHFMLFIVMQSACVIVVCVCGKVIVYIPTREMNNVYVFFRLFAILFVRVYRKLSCVILFAFCCYYTEK